VTVARARLRFWLPPAAAIDAAPRFCPTVAELLRLLPCRQQVGASTWAGLIGG
jgi:hypothetical protein